MEEQNQMTFKSELFERFALVCNRFVNFPFQTWELRPEAEYYHRNTKRKQILSPLFPAELSLLL